MSKTLRYGAAMLVAVLVSTCAQAADRSVTRAYLMRGLGGLFISNGMDQIGAKLRARGVIVSVGGWMAWPLFAADAARHPRDRIVFSGHSMGARAAGEAADAMPRGAKVKVVGIDPLCAYASVRRGTNAVNFTRGISLACGSHGAMVNARNISLAAYRDSHIGIVSDQRVQARVVAAALSQ